MSCFYCLESRAPLKLCRHCRRIRACSEEHLAIHRGRRGAAAAWDSAANSACSSAAGSRCGSRSRSGSTSNNNSGRPRRPSSSSASNPAAAPAAKCFPFKIAKIPGKGLAMVATRFLLVSFCADQLISLNNLPFFLPQRHQASGAHPGRMPRRTGSLPQNETAVPRMLQVKTFKKRKRKEFVCNSF